MSVWLSDSNIELIENFISSNQLATNTLGISISDFAYGQICYQKMLSSPTTSYIQFSSNTFDMTSYGLYKTIYNEIYVIEAFCNNITCYYTPEMCGISLDGLIEI
jgi:hypothetical protein